MPPFRIIPVYCGGQRPPPNDRPLGTPAQCFASGRRGGFVAGIQKGFVEGTNTEKEKQQKKQKIKETITRTLTKQQFVSEIEDKGLNFLKKESILRSSITSVVNSFDNSLIITGISILSNFLYSTLLVVKLYSMFASI
jgi:hypothetical protein